MHSSNSPGKLSIKYLHSSFKKVEDYEKEVQTISDIERKFRNTESPLRLRKKSNKKSIELPKFNDTFHNMPLEKQIEAIMEPVVNPRIKAESLLKLMDDKDNSRVLSRDLEKLSSQTPDLKTSSQANLKHPLMKPKFHSVSSKTFKAIKRTPLLPQIEESGSFMTMQSGKYWHYHHSLKNDPLLQSYTIADISDSLDKHIIDPKTAFDKPKTSLHPKPNYSVAKTSVLLNDELHQGQKNAHSLAQFYKKEEIRLSPNKDDPYNNLLPQNNQGILLLEEFEDPNAASAQSKKEGATLDRIESNPEPNNDASNLLNISSLNGDLKRITKNRLSLNQSRSQNPHKNPDKRHSTYEQDDKSQDHSSYTRIDKYNSLLDDSRTENRNLSTLALNRKASPAPDKKKGYYNKWFIPIKYWKISKELDPIEKKYDDLRKDKNYFYHNMHNYESKQSSDPTKQQTEKTFQQISFEGLQQKLKQNIIMKRYKKQLAEHGQRIPHFLKTVEDGTNINFSHK